MTEASRRERKARRPSGARGTGEAPLRGRGAAITPSDDDAGGEKGADVAAEVEASELRLARRVAVVAPVATILGAAVVGTFVALGPGLLVLAGGALFGTIAFFWASLRTLGGEAPLAEGFAEIARRRVVSPDAAAERKRTALRALKDLELEHSIGKIDDADYAELSARYRDEAKAILREMDRDVEPLRARAEQLARSYLAKRGAAPQEPSNLEPDRPERTPAEDGVAPKAAERRACPSCLAKNEVDAVFCKACAARLAPRECPHCAVVNEPDATFCKRCGKSLEAEKKGGTDASA